MAKIDVELTSRRDDGNWTWRAVGAREPRGTVDSSLLNADVRIGSQFSVETEHFIDGIVVTKVFERKQSSDKGDVIEILGSGKNLDPVTTQLTKSKKGKKPSKRSPAAKTTKDQPSSKKARKKILRNQNLGIKLLKASQKIISLNPQKVSDLNRSDTSEMLQLKVYLIKQPELERFF